MKSSLETFGENEFKTVKVEVSNFKMKPSDLLYDFFVSFTKLQQFKLTLLLMQLLSSLSSTDVQFCIVILTQQINVRKIDARHG